MIAVCNTYSNLLSRVSSRLANDSIFDLWQNINMQHFRQTWITTSREHNKTEGKMKTLWWLNGLRMTPRRKRENTMNAVYASRYIVWISCKIMILVWFPEIDLFIFGLMSNIHFWVDEWRRARRMPVELLCYQMQSRRHHIRELFWADCVSLCICRHRTVCVCVFKNMPWTRIIIPSIIWSSMTSFVLRWFYLAMFVYYFALLSYTKTRFNASTWLNTMKHPFAFVGCYFWWPNHAMTIVFFCKY